MSETSENLKNAFAGESQANRRYTAFARKADQEGLAQIAKLFRAAAEAETVHALNHLRIMGELKETAANLDAALSGETFEFRKMYPEYLNVAKHEGNKLAAWSFDVANQVEQIHASLYTKAIEALQSKEGLAETDYYVCMYAATQLRAARPKNAQSAGHLETNSTKQANTVLSRISESLYDFEKKLSTASANISSPETNHSANKTKYGELLLR